MLTIGLLGAGGAAEYSRPLGAKNLDQATLDSEGYGEKKAFKREDDGLRITLSPGDQETGWKTPQQVRFGGDFTISAEFVIKKLPKPAMEDGAAIGLAIAFNDINQPDVTLVRLLETNGSDVYRPIEKAGGGPMPMMAQTRAQMRMQMMGMGMVMQPGGKPPKPPAPDFPSGGRRGPDGAAAGRHDDPLFRSSTRSRPDRATWARSTLGPMDVAAVKLFATNRNGAEAVNVLLRDLTIHADRINGLGTLVRTVFDEVIYNEPTSLDNGVLTLGGPPKAAGSQSAGSAGRCLRQLTSPGRRRRKAATNVAATPAAAVPATLQLRLRSLPRPLHPHARRRTPGCGRGHAGGCRDGRARRSDAGRGQSSREPSRRRWPRGGRGSPHSRSSLVRQSRKCGCRSMRSRASASSARP